VHPNPFSWLIWSLVASLAAAGSWRAGATWPLGGALANALGCLAVLMSTLGRRRFVADRIDLGCLAVAAAGIVAWSWTSEPVIGLALFLAADAAGAVPTLRAAALDGRSESVAGWALLALAGLAAVCSIEPVQWIWTWAGFGHGSSAMLVHSASDVCIVEKEDWLIGGKERLDRGAVALVDASVRDQEVEGARQLC
jgi:hypothetical protein